MTPVSLLITPASYFDGDYFEFLGFLFPRVPPLERRSKYGRRNVSLARNAMGSLIGCFNTSFMIFILFIEFTVKGT